MAKATSGFVGSDCNFVEGFKICTFPYSKAALEKINRHGYIKNVLADRVDE